MSKAETCGQRMASRRKELDLVQADIAGRVRLAGTSERQRLSVTAYAMYELDQLDPSIRIVEEIAAALLVDPAWLAFGASPSARSHAAFANVARCDA